MGQIENMGIVRFRHWVDDYVRFEGEAIITKYSGTGHRDEFGMLDDDEYIADIRVLYKINESNFESLQDNEAYELNPKIPQYMHCILEKMAIMAFFDPPAIPVLFPFDNADAISDKEHIPNKSKVQNFSIKSNAREIEILKGFKVE